MDHMVLFIYVWFWQVCVATCINAYADSTSLRYQEGCLFSISQLWLCNDWRCTVLPFDFSLKCLLRTSCNVWPPSDSLTMLLFLAPLMYIGDFKAPRQAFAVAITEGKGTDTGEVYIMCGASVLHVQQNCDRHLYLCGARISCWMLNIAK